MVHMARDLDRYHHVLDMIQGQIWDSAVELSEIPIGVPKAMFPKNDTLQRALKNYLMYVQFFSFMNMKILINFFLRTDII